MCPTLNEACNAITKYIGKRDKSKRATRNTCNDPPDVAVTLFN